MENSLKITQTIDQWLLENLDIFQARERLEASGMPADNIAAILDAFRKKRNEKRQVTAFTLMGIGAFLGFLSCVLSITNPFPDLFYWILYGLTSVALMIIFIGLYYLLE
jgi:hypothetical protein